MEAIKTGDKVQIMEYGQWTGPYYVIATTGGRTEDHITLKTGCCTFEHYADEYNTRKV